MKQELSKYITNRQDIYLFKNISIKEISRRLLIIMENCKGENNKVSKTQLFLNVFGSKPKSFLTEYICLDLLNKGMHYCRKYTKCFIVSKLIDNEYFYYIPTNIYEIEPYILKLTSIEKQIKYMKIKAIKSINDKWYLNNFSEDIKQLK